MSEWKEKTLGELSIRVSSGLTPIKSNKKFWENPSIPWLKTDQLGEKYIFDTNTKISKEALEQTSLRIYPENTVSIAMYGEGKTRGNISIIKAPMTTNQACCNIEIDPKLADVEYVYYYLKTQYDSLRKLSSGVRKNLNSNDIKNYKIYIPESVSVQKSIIRILTSLDNKINLNNQINQELEAMAKTLYDYWFVQFDFPDQNGKPYKSSGGKMVYHPELKREIPEGWGVEKLGELIEIERGVTYSKSDIVEKTTKDAIGVLRATNITGNVMDLNDLVYLTKDKINNKQIIKQNEILIVMSSGSKEHLGKNAINYYEEVIGFGAFCSKIVPQKYSAFINTFLQSSEFKGYLLKQSMGTNINNLTNSDMLDCRIILPNEEILDKFENIVEKNIRLISNNYIQNQELTQLRDWLLPMLMNGQVKVE